MPEVPDLDDQAEFTAIVQRHRRELHVHCYRMLGSLDDAEDIVQETFLRGWRARESFDGRSTVRAWLYRIATNACLDALARRRRRALPYSLSPAAVAGHQEPPLSEATWLQPYPDQLLYAPTGPDTQPEALVIAGETIELAFVAALQQLPPRQRAVLVLRDLLGWSAAQVSASLGTSVAAVNSGSQRARATLRRHLGERSGWTRPPRLSETERQLLTRFMSALERSDVATIADLLLPDARGAMPPFPMWYSGRDAIVATLARGFELYGRFSVLPTSANGAPAVALYRRPEPAQNADVHEAVGVSVLALRNGGIAEITSFMDSHLLAWFGLPSILPAASRNRR